MGYIWKFDNMETKKEHEVSLVLAYLKCTYHFEILAWTLDQVFIMVSFYSDVGLMHKLGK